MPLLSKNSIIKLNDTVRTVQNTPVGNQSRHYRRKPASSDYPHMAINRTEDELKIGYIVEVVAFDGDKNLFTIQQPSADNLPNVAVVLTPAVVGHMVALSFTGPHMLWADYVAETPASWGSTEGSYRAKEGSTFTHIAHTSFLSDTDRVCACFSGGDLFIEKHSISISKEGEAWTLCSYSTRNDDEEFGNCVDLSEMLEDIELSDDYITDPTHVYARNASGETGWVPVAEFACPLP